MNQSDVLKKLENELKQIGFTNIDKDRLSRRINEGADHFSFRHWQMKDEVKLKSTIDFVKENDDYKINQYELMTIPKLPIEHAVIGNIDTRAFDQELKNVDWNFELAETPEKELEGYRVLEGINNTFKELVNEKAGIPAASLLWHNNVPIGSASKPKEIETFEDDCGLYHRSFFKPTTSVDDATFILSNFYNVGKIDLGNDGGPEIMLSGYDEPVIYDHSQIDLIKDKLFKEWDDGAKYVVLHTNTAIHGPDGLVFFKNSFEAAEHIYQSSTDRDFYEGLTIGELMRSVNMWERNVNGIDKLLPLAESNIEQLSRNQRAPVHYDDFTRREKCLEQSVYLLKLLNEKGHKDEAVKLWDKHITGDSFSKPEFLLDRTAVVKEVQFPGPYEQLQKANLGIGYNVGLVSDMKAGKPFIAQPLDVNYPNDEKAAFTLYWNRSLKTGDYHLNKWDIKATGPMVEGEVTRTYFNNNLQRLQYTAEDKSKMYMQLDPEQSKNYLMGRAVYAKSVNVNGYSENCYELLAYSENGNSYPRKFRKEYPFDLDNVMQKYAGSIVNFYDRNGVENFANELKRGNVVNATFVENDGRKAQMKVVLNIPVGCLDVYTQYKKGAVPLSPELMVEKGFIPPDYGNQIRARIDKLAADKIAREQAKEQANNKTDKRDEIKAIQNNCLPGNSKKDDQAPVKKHKPLKH